MQHKAILASAGSGKTYALTNRFIYLLHQFEQPERIVALTFTRTAAGEFFQKIVEKLCKAAENPESAKALSTELSIQADKQRYEHLLKLLLQSMHRLNLQTLDSFFFRIASVFALELGLPDDLELLDEAGAARMQCEMRDRIVHRPVAIDDNLGEFWHALKQATFGKTTRDVGAIVAHYIEHLYEHYLDAPQSDYWGQIITLWPQGCTWRLEQPTNWNQLAAALLAALPSELTDNQRISFETTAEHIRKYPSEEKLNTLLSNAFKIAPDIFSGQATIKVRKALKLAEPLCQALAECLRAIVWHHLKRALNNTQGVYRILRAYHDQYEQTVRSGGKLAFADLTQLLAPDAKGSPMTKACSTARQLMEFRLDGCLDHWLFDEFQDTSRSQWQVVANLVDEIIQDDSGQRSLFYVGDTKQCLYLWRNSDDRLFHDIQKHYNANGETRIVLQPLATSWRSAPAIIDSVNTIFSDQGTISATFSADAAARWKRSWQAHTASLATAKLNGFACWLEAKNDEGPTRNELILQLLKDLDPGQGKMSVGVLVRKNSDANEIVGYLREKSTLTIHNGSAAKPATDNVAGIALLSLLQLAAHPGDTLAQGYLELIDTSTTGLPLAKNAAILRERLLSESSKSALRWAARQIAAHLPENATWHRERLQQLVDRAHLFDNEPVRDVDRLIRFLKGSSASEPPTKTSVVVETIHKSKGLEYDVVIFANEDKFLRNETNISPLKDENGEPEWLLQPIRKEFMRVDPTLKKLLDQTTSQRDFGNLCTLYVAITRAKRGLYMISDIKRAHQASTVNFLKQVLGSDSEPKCLFPNAAKYQYPILWSTGDANWYTDFKPAIPSSAPKTEPEIKSFPAAHLRLKLARPSTQRKQAVSAAQCFDLDESAAKFGTLVHEAFEQIEWYQGLPSVTDNVVKETLQNCFEQSDIRSLFTQPSGSTTVWRERAFSYIEGDHLINGVFDRVVLHQGEDGTITRAEIIDFKTDRIHAKKSLKQAVAQHRPQLENYRKALARIVGIQENSIELKLLFTHVPKCVNL